MQNISYQRSMARRIVMIVAGIGLACAASAAQSWRFGLRQAKINAQSDWTTTPTYTQITAVGPAMAHVKATESDYSTQTYVDPVTGSSSNWNKQKTTFCYEGQIYLTGGKQYVFGKYLDDAAIIHVDGTKILDNSSYNTFTIGTFSPETSGWYDFTCRIGDGTGGKGPTVGSWTTTIGLGYNTCNLTSQSAPGTDPDAAWVKLANTDDAPGGLFRVPVQEDFFSLDRLVKVEGGYNVKVIATRPGSAVVYFGAAMGTAEQTNSWDGVSGAVAFTAGDLEKDVFFAWTEETDPYFAVKFWGSDAESAFLQWTDGYRLVPMPQVTAAVVNIQPTEVTIGQNLSFVFEIEGVAMPDISVVAYYDSTDKGTSAESWSSSTNLGVCALGPSAFPIGGLTPGDDYCVRLRATAGEVSVWSDPIPFSTGGAFLEAPASLYENDTKTRQFTVRRPATATAEDLVVYLTYSSNAATLVSALPPSVTIPAGAVFADVTFTTIDNNMADGNAVLTVMIAEDAGYVRGNPYTADITIVDDESLASGVCTWTGSAGDRKWNTPGNWDLGRVPTIVDTARFASSGLSANETISVDTEAIIKELRIETTTAFTLAEDTNGGSLELGAITRVDVDGTEGSHTLSVPTYLYAGSDTNCVWNIAGSGALVIRCDFTKADGTYVYKTGSGTVEMRYKNTTFGGPWIIYEGTILCPEDQGATFKGTTVIGGGPNPAKLQQSKKNSIAGKTPVDVLRNGTFQSGDIDNGRVESITVRAGGVASIGSYFYTLYANFYGGTYNGGATYNCKDIRSYASDTMAVMNAYWRFEGYYDYGVYVDRGTAPVDLKITNGLAEGNSGKKITKNNAGIVRSTANFGNLKNHFRIAGGAWYVDNPGEYGLGIQTTTVAAGATLGGTGCVGMKDVKGTATVTVENGTSSKYGSVVAGTIDDTTGAPVYGTLKLARESAHNLVSLGTYTHVVAGLGAMVYDADQGRKVSPNDKLLVYGPLTLGANCVLDLAIRSAADLASIKGGTYTVVEADRINGTFASVVLPEGVKWRVDYRTRPAEEEGADPIVYRIDVTINKGLALFVR